MNTYYIYIILSVLFSYNISLDSIREDWQSENHDKKTGFYLGFIYFAKFLVNLFLWPLTVSNIIWNKLTK